MENFINGKDANKKLITYLGIRMQSLINEAKIYSEIAGLEEEVVKVGDDVFIRKEKYAEYGLLSELNSYISFEKNPSEDTYEFKGFKYTQGTDEKKTTIYVSKENALKISKMADSLESILGVRLPAELYLLKYKDDNMPGLDYKMPEPKTADKDRTAHEAELERYYQAHGVNKEADPTLGFRKPYPHEKINGRNVAPEITDVPQEGYYTAVTEEINTRVNDMDHGDPGLQPGETQPITGVDLPLGQKIGRGLLRFKNFMTDKEVHSKFLKTLAVVGVGAAVVALFASKPILAVSIAVGAGVGYVGGKFVYPAGSKAWKSAKKKIKEWLFGPDLTNEPQEPQPEPEPTMTPEQINERIEQLQIEQYRLQQENIQIDEAAKKLPEGDARRIQLEQKMNQNNQRLNSIQEEISSLLYNHDEEHTRGGR